MVRNRRFQPQVGRALGLAEQLEELPSFWPHPAVRLLSDIDQAQHRDPVRYVQRCCIWGSP